MPSQLLFVLSKICVVKPISCVIDCSIEIILMICHWTNSHPWQSGIHWWLKRYLVLFALVYISHSDLLSKKKVLCFEWYWGRSMRLVWLNDLPWWENGPHIMKFAWKLKLTQVVVGITGTLLYHGIWLKIETCTSCGCYQWYSLFFSAS